MVRGAAGCVQAWPARVISVTLGVSMVLGRRGRAELIEVGGGGSQIFGPDGSTIAGPGPWEEETILYAEIDLYDIARAKNFADPAGHYARPDVLSLLWNRTPQVCVRDSLVEEAEAAQAGMEFETDDSLELPPGCEDSGAGTR